LILVPRSTLVRYLALTAVLTLHAMVRSALLFKLVNRKSGVDGHGSSRMASYSKVNRGLGAIPVRCRVIGVVADHHHGCHPDSSYTDLVKGWKGIKCLNVERAT
jgi:hypothetical protein